MKRTILLSLLSLFVVSTAAAEPPKPAQGIRPIKPLPVKPLPVKPLPAPKPVLQCPDPAVTSIDFALVSRASRFAGQVQVTGKVKNVGAAHYVSRPDQQVVQLYEIAPGGRPRLVAQRAFQNVAPGEELSVSFTRAWDASSPAEGEFAPTYRVVIAYDPDIRLDGNPRNDDCNARNDARDRSGADINAMFR